MIAVDFGPQFSLGKVVITPGAALKLPPDDVTVALRRHARGDWGEVDPFDKQLNEQPLERGGPLASIYRASNGIQFSS